MLKRLVRLAVKLALLGALMWLARELLSRWVDGPTPIPSKEPWPPVVSATDVVPPKAAPAPEKAQGKSAAAASRTAPTRTARATPSRPRSTPSKIVTGSDDRRPPKKAATKRPADKKPAPAKIAPGKVEPTRSWVEPIDGGCPSTHQVKAKLASMLYHLPGMAAYDRTQPDRCYASAEAAESEGFTKAKR